MFGFMALDERDPNPQWGTIALFFIGVSVITVIVEGASTLFGLFPPVDGLVKGAGE